MPNALTTKHLLDAELAGLTLRVRNTRLAHAGGVLFEIRADVARAVAYVARAGIAVRARRILRAGALDTHVGFNACVGFQFGGANVSALLPAIVVG